MSGHNKLNQKQKAYIRKNHSKMLIKELALGGNASKYLVTKYLNEMNLSTRKKRPVLKGKVIQMSEFFDPKYHRAFF